MVVYFGEEVEHALKTYLYTTRKSTVPLSGHENALFLPHQRKRMGVQAVENMVKKYAREVTPEQKRSHHINCEAPTVLLSIKKPVIFTL